MKILLVEDDIKTADFIHKGLIQEGCTVCHVENGGKGLFKAATEEFDVIITDIMMPGIDGFEMIEKIRKRKIETPILVLSAKGTVDDRVKGLQLGGDDYLVKPFAFSELIARIHSLVRRSKGQSSEPTQIEIADMVIDLIKRKVYRHQDEIILPPLEFNLLAYLTQHQERVVSKTMIIENVWEYNFDPGTNVVEARVCRLREKIDKPYDIKLIHTVRGFGYIVEPRQK